MLSEAYSLGLKSCTRNFHCRSPVSSKMDEAGDSAAKRGSVPSSKRPTLAKDLAYQDSPSSALATKHLVVVMDALKDFSVEPLEWALNHVIEPGYVVTLLGVMPWLNLPLSCKTWLDVWALDIGDLSALNQMGQLKNDSKSQKLRRVIELCNKYGVAPYMKVAMGHPLKLVVLEQTTNLHATWIVFDRHIRKDRSFYANRIPCNLVMMNHHGEVDMLKFRPMIRSEESTPIASPSSMPLIPKVIISKELLEILEGKGNVKSRLEPWPEGNEDSDN